MAIAPITVGDVQSISKINQAIAKANLVDGLVAETGNKADQTDLDSLVAEVGTKAAQSDVDGLVTEVGGKADQDDVDALAVGKADRASPVLVGTPTTPTAAVGTNTQQIANMAALEARTAPQEINQILTVSGINDLIATPRVAISSYIVGRLFRFAPTETNTGPMTLNIGGVGPAPLRDADGANLTGGEVVAGRVYVIGVYGGQYFRLISGDEGRSYRKRLDTLDNRIAASIPDAVRGGDFTELYTESLAAGDPAKLAPVTGQMVVSTSEGPALRMTGQNIQTLALRNKYPIEPNRRYRVRWLVQRAVNSPDPANDAVRAAVAWYGSGKGVISPTDTVIEDLTSLVQGSGFVTVEAIISRNAGAGVDVVAPSSARYATPYVTTWGALQETRVLLIGWQDVTDAGVVSPDVSALEGRVSAQESLDAGTRLDVLETAIDAPEVARLPASVDLPGTTIPATVELIEMLGAMMPGDGGGYVNYRQVAAEPAHAFYISKGGAFFEGSLSDHVTLRALGAKGDGTTFEDVATLNAKLAGARAVGIRKIEGLDRTYRFNGSTALVIPTGMSLEGCKLDIQNMTASSRAISCVGSQGATAPLTADALFGELIVTVASTAGWSAGDLLFIEDPAVTWWSTFKNSELARIRSILNGTQLLLEDSLGNDYLLANGATVRKVNAEYRGVSIKDGEIVGGGAGLLQVGWEFQYASDITIENVETYALDYVHGWYKRCAGVVSKKNRMRKATSPGLAYGEVFGDGCLDCEVDGGDGAWMRHRVSVGGAGGVSRKLRIHHLNCTHMTDAGIDAHPQCQDMTVDHCETDGDWGYAGESGGGLTFQGVNLTATGNRFRNIKGSAISVEGAVVGNKYPSRSTIIGNDGERIGVSLARINANAARTMGPQVAMGNTGQGIGSLATSVGALYAQASAGDIEAVTFRGNTLTEVDCHGCRLDAPSPRTIMQVDVDERPNVSFSAAGIASGRVLVTRGGTTSRALVLASDTITLPYFAGGYAEFTVDTEAAAATDNLTTIIGGQIGDRILLRTANSSRDVTVLHDATKIRMVGAANAALIATYQNVMLTKISATVWTEVSRALVS